MKGQAPKVTGRVYDDESGEPLPDHIVRAYDVAVQDKLPPLGQGRSRKDGSFTIGWRRAAAVSEVVGLFPEGGPDLDLRVYAPDGHPVGNIGPLEGDERWEPQEIGVSPRPAHLLNRRMWNAIEGFFLQPENLELVSRILSEEYGVSEEVIAKELKEADPFGISPSTFRTTVCCILNNLLDDFKQTPLAHQLIFNGNTYKHMGAIVVEGFLLGSEPSATSHGRGPYIHEGFEGRIETDEDWNFKLRPQRPNLQQLLARAEANGIPVGETNVQRLNTGSQYLNRVQCEVIPCDQVGALRRKLHQLKSRARNLKADELAGRPVQPIRLRVFGTFTWDGTHSGPLGGETYHGHAEVHPVRDIEFLP